MTPWKSYHLLGAALDASAARPEAFFAWSVDGIVDGFIDHTAYLRIAQVATRRRATADGLERRVAELAGLDINPVATLLHAAPDAASFETRWNGFNRVAPLGVETVVTHAPQRRLRREARGDDASGELRARVTTACVDHLLGEVDARPPAGEPHDGTPALLRNLRRLGIGQQALHELLECLHADPAASLDRCAAALGSSRRSLQRELGHAGLGFSRLRQAVRLTLATEAVADPGRPLTDIAHASGFFDSAHFAHAWRRSCGIAPSQYRHLACSTRSHRDRGG